jgi:hypothetical protein
MFGVLSEIPRSPLGSGRPPWQAALSEFLEAHGEGIGAVEGEDQGAANLMVLHLFQEGKYESLQTEILIKPAISCVPVVQFGSSAKFVG